MRNYSKCLIETLLLITHKIFLNEEILMFTHKNTLFYGNLVIIPIMPPDLVIKVWSKEKKMLCLGNQTLLNLLVKPKVFLAF